MDRAKLVDFHFHDLRHAFASWAVQRGASLQEVKDPAQEGLVQEALLSK